MKSSHINYKGEWIPLSKVEFVNIEEDFSGRDLVTFRKDGKEHQSFVTLRPSAQQLRTATTKCGLGRVVASYRGEKTEDKA